MIRNGRFDHAIEQGTLLLLGTLLALAGGALVAIGSVNATLVLLIIIGGVIALLRPVASLYLLILIGLLLTGFVRLYFPGFEKIQWGVASLATILGGIAIAGHLFKPQRGLEIPPNSGVLCIFVLLICATAVVNVQEPGKFLYGFKGYAQVMGTFFAICLLTMPGRAIDGLPRLLVAIAVLQLPFVLHQYLFLVPARIAMANGVVAEDVVAGTMGASITGGGSNAVLSLLLITAIAIVAAGYKRGEVKARFAGPVAVVCAIPLFLNANRIALLYLLIVFAMIFGPSMFRRLSRFFIGGLLTAAIVTGSIWVSLNYGSRSSEYADWQDLVQTTIERNTYGEVGYGSLELNRMGSITFWWSEQFRIRNVRAFLFGYGPGEAREATDSTLGVRTLANTRYPGTGIGLTGISSILWELGLVGLLVVTALLTNGYRSAHYLVTQLRDNPYRQYVAEGLQVSVVVFAISLFHKNTIVFHLAYQMILYTVLGVLAAWHFAELKKEKDARPDPHDIPFQNA